MTKIAGTRDASRVAKAHYVTIWIAIDTGELHATKHKNTWFIEVDDLRDWCKRTGREFNEKMAEEIAI